MKMAPVLNRNLACPACGSDGQWCLVSKPKVRRNSTISELRCSTCNGRIAAKMPHANDLRGGSRRLIQREFQTLSLLQKVFAHDDQYGTILPLAWFDGVMITRWFAGADLRRYLRTVDGKSSFEVYRCAGTWLRRLHDSSPDGVTFETFNVADKLDTLADRYSPMLNHAQGPTTEWDALKDRADAVAKQPVRVTWSHGDFKPDNMLCDGRRYVGLDIHLQFRAPVVLDIASFLDHAWLDGQGLLSARSRHQFWELEQSFLQGYGKLEEQDMIALRWAQLYFALSYVGRSWLRGPLRALHANVRVGPLVRVLAERLREQV